MCYDNSHSFFYPFKLPNIFNLVFVQCIFFRGNGIKNGIITSLTTTHMVGKHGEVAVETR